MAQITSREELEEWLEHKPLDWTQILTARVALRALPFELGYDFVDQFVESSPLVVFRAACISWAARSFPEYDMAYSAALSAKLVKPTFSTGFLTSALAAVAAGDSFYRVSSGRNFRPNAVYGGTSSILQTTFSNAGHNDESLHNFTADYAWLSANEILNSNSRGLAAQKLWPFGSSIGWSHGCRLSLNSLLELSPTYQVWIDWYNRRVEGHDAAFDIPGDTDRVHDKAILARLADATDEGFWGKGATYVNTTLQRWIDEARLTAELESIVRRLGEGAATQFGSPEARETLAALRTKLEAALGNQTPAHAPIGHNHPPEGINPAEAPILPPAIREEAQAMLVTIDQPTPDALVVAKTLTGWSKIKSTFQHDEFSKNFSGELGTSTARGIVLILTSLCLLGLAWLKVMLAI